MIEGPNIRDVYTIVSISVPAKISRVPINSTVLFFFLTFRLFSQEHVNVRLYACDTCTTVDVLSIDPVLIKMHFKKVINEFIFSQQKRVNLL